MNLDIFNITHNQISPETGKVIVSVPFINDTFFSKAVILLTLHNSEGSVGYILNKSLPMKLHELVEDIPHSNFSVGIGGPVANDRLQMLHTLGNVIPDSEKINEGLYWGGNFDVVRELIHKREIFPHQIRFFLGYSGWGVNQLDTEIKSDSWLVAEMDSQQIITQTDENLWKKVLHKMGNKYQAWADFPSDPALN